MNGFTRTRRFTTDKASEKVWGKVCAPFGELNDDYWCWIPGMNAVRLVNGAAPRQNAALLFSNRAGEGIAGVLDVYSPATRSLAYSLHDGATGGSAALSISIKVRSASEGGAIIDLSLSWYYPATSFAEILFSVVQRYFDKRGSNEFVDHYMRCLESEISRA